MHGTVPATCRAPRNGPSTTTITCQHREGAHLLDKLCDLLEALDELDDIEPDAFVAYLEHESTKPSSAGSMMPMRVSTTAERTSPSPPSKKPPCLRMLDTLARYFNR